MLITQERFLFAWGHSVIVIACRQSDTLMMGYHGLLLHPLLMSDVII